MYTEFLLIFVGLGLIIALLVTVIILLIIMMRKSSNDLPIGTFVTSANKTQFPTSSKSKQESPMPNASAANHSVVFCKNCFTQFDSAAQFCPKCGTPRN